MEIIAGPYTYDEYDQMILHSNKGGGIVADMRGYGYLTGKGHSGLGLPHDEAVRIHDNTGRMLASAPDMANRIAELEAENARLREALSRRVKLADHDEACFCSSMPGLPRGVRDDNCTCSIRDDMSLLSPTNESEDGNGE